MILDPGPTLLYLQLRRILADKILSQEFKENDRLSTEAQLSEHFGVSRATVLRALEGLLRVGLIYSERGRGTFVARGARRMNPTLKGAGIITGESTTINTSITTRAWDQKWRNGLFTKRRSRGFLAPGAQLMPPCGIIP